MQRVTDVVHMALFISRLTIVHNFVTWWEDVESESFLVSIFALYVQKVSIMVFIIRNFPHALYD